MALGKENYLRPNSGTINKFASEPQAIDYEDDRIGILLELTNNLEKFYKENPDLFANEEEFKKNFHYDERSPMQQALVQGFRNKKQMEPTKPEDSNEDIFGEVVGEVETTDNGTERDALVGGGSVAEEPKKPEASKVPEKNNTEKAQENIDKGTKYQTTIQEGKAEDTKAKGEKKRVNVKERLASLGK